MESEEAEVMELEQEEISDEALHPVVELLLARMESNPEEFLDQYKWTRKYEPYKQYMTKREKEAMRMGMRKVMMNHLHEIVMKELLDPKQDRDAEMKARLAALMAQKQVQTAIPGQLLPNIWTQTTGTTGGAVQGYYDAVNSPTAAGASTYATGTTPTIWQRALGVFSK